MSTKMQLVQRSMIFLVICLCYIAANAEKEEYGTVDCELYPFYRTCRGSMSKKRAMIAGSLHGLDCDGNKGDLDCIRLKNFAEKQRRISYLPLSRSKLWITLLDDDIQKNSPYEGYPANYEARHKKRRNNDLEQRYEGRRIPPIENFWNELENSDSDY